VPLLESWQQAIIIEGKETKIKIRRYFSELLTQVFAPPGFSSLPLMISRFSYIVSITVYLSEEQLIKNGNASLK
jgi:hypothetical protein